VEVFWIQVGIAAANMENKIYLDDTEAELNRLVFEFFPKA